MQTTPHTTEEVREALNEVLGLEESPPTMLEEFLEWIDQRLGFGTGGSVPDFVGWILLAIFVALLIRFLLRLRLDGWFGGSRLRLDEESSGPPLAERIAILRREAREARSRGDARLALRKLLFALVLGLGGRGDIEFRDAWTYRELLRRGRPSREVNALLGPLVDELEAKEFGREPVGEPDLDQLETLCDRYLGSAA